MLIDRRRALALARKPELPAVLAGVLVVLGVFLFVGGGAGHPHPGATRRSRVAHKLGPGPLPSVRRPPTSASARSKAGAVRAATSDLTELSAAGVGSRTQARQVVAAVVTGSLQSRLERSLPVVAGEVQARLRGSRTPHVFDGWPLGFRVETFEASQATVAVWHLDVGASSALGLMTAQYTTTTYDLRWSEGSWRMDAVSAIPGPTPPSASAPPAEVDEFAREVNALSPYAYGP